MLMNQTTNFLWSHKFYIPQSIS